MGPASPAYHQRQRRTTRPACLRCRRRTTPIGSSSDQSSPFDCLALGHSFRSWKRVELNPKEERTVHNQSNRHLKEDRQRLEVRDPTHVNNKSSQLPVRSKRDLCPLVHVVCLYRINDSPTRTSRILGCRFDEAVRRSFPIGGLSNAKLPRIRLHLFQ